MKLRGKDVCDVEIDGVDRRDHPDYCDAYFSSAVWCDSGNELDDDDLIQLAEENPGVLNQMAEESAF